MNSQLLQGVHIDWNKISAYSYLKDVETTLNIYADVTKELKQQEFSAFQKKLEGKD